MDQGDPQGPRDPHEGTGENLFSRRVRAGKRTYFFDVKATRSAKDCYIVITESRRMSEDSYEKHKVFLYKEDFSKFSEALAETCRFVERELHARAGDRTSSPASGIPPPAAPVP